MRQLDNVSQIYIIYLKKIYFIAVSQFWVRCCNLRSHPCAVAAESVCTAASGPCGID